MSVRVSDRSRFPEGPSAQLLFLPSTLFCASPSPPPPVASLTVSLALGAPAEAPYPPPPATTGSALESPGPERLLHQVRGPGGGQEGSDRGGAGSDYRGPARGAGRGEAGCSAGSGRALPTTREEAGGRARVDLGRAST